MSERRKINRRKNLPPMFTAPLTGRRVYGGRRLEQRRDAKSRMTDEAVMWWKEGYLAHLRRIYPFFTEAHLLSEVNRAFVLYVGRKNV